MGILDSYLKASKQKQKESVERAKRERSAPHPHPKIKKKPVTLREKIWAIDVEDSTTRDRRDPWYIKHDAIKISKVLEDDMKAGLQMIKDSTVIQDIRDICDDLIKLVDTEWEDD